LQQKISEKLQNFAFISHFAHFFTLFDSYFWPKTLKDAVLRAFEVLCNDRARPESE